MKKLLLILILGISFQAKSQYYPMLTDSNVWAVYMDVIPLIQQSHQPPTVQNIGAGYVYKVNDTVIGAYTYTRFYSLTNDGNPGMWSLMREDTVTQQVFVWTAGDTTERIIYDFSLNAGDSIWLEFSYQGSGELQTGWWYVDSTNTYMIDAGPRKALYLTNPNNPLHNGNQVRFIQWIESVGCNVSPIYLDEITTESFSPCENFMGPGCAQNTHMTSTTCAWHENTMTFSSECWENVRPQVSFSYMNGDTCVFMLMGAVDDPSTGIDKIELMPNPANGNSTLYFTTGNANVFSVSITNMLGETVQQTARSTWYAKGAHTIEIDLSGFAPGIYSVNLVGESGRMSVKLIVQ